MAKEIANKQLSSKSIEHVVGYPIIKDVTDYALSYSLVSYVYQQAYLITGFFFANFVAPFPVVKNNLHWVDSQVDLVVLTRVDQVVDKANNFHPVSTVEKKYLAPVNSYIYNTVDKYLPGSATENKATFKLDDLKESSEVSKFFRILNETYSRSKQLATAKSSEVTNTVTDTYNKEVGKCFWRFAKEGSCLIQHFDQVCVRHQQQFHSSIERSNPRLRCRCCNHHQE